VPDWGVGVVGAVGAIGIVALALAFEEAAHVSGTCEHRIAERELV
jgi:hypothetical protein